MFTTCCYRVHGILAGWFCSGPRAAPAECLLVHQRKSVYSFCTNAKGAYTLQEQLRGHSKTSLQAACKELSVQIRSSSGSLNSSCVWERKPLLYRRQTQAHDHPIADASRVHQFKRSVRSQFCPFFTRSPTRSHMWRPMAGVSLGWESFSATTVAPLPPSLRRVHLVVATADRVSLMLCPPALLL